jgi:acylphosphatase
VKNVGGQGDLAPRTSVGHPLTMTRPAARLRIEGLVQGVGYRWWAVGEAGRLGLCGEARNRPDGTVEVLAIGEAAAIDALEAACWKGPPAARVSAVVRTPAADDGSVDFRQAATG